MDSVNDFWVTDFTIDYCSMKETYNEQSAIKSNMRNKLTSLACKNRKLNSRTANKN